MIKILTLLLVIALMQACKQPTVVTETTSAGDTTISTMTEISEGVDPYPADTSLEDTVILEEEWPDKSYMLAYTQVFEPHCSIGGCHDGNFEPDFSSPERGYSTLVFHGVLKNVTSGPRFNYRVIPGDTAGSLLWERLTNENFVDPEDKMPLYFSIDPQKLDYVRDWILAGARGIQNDSLIREGNPPYTRGVVMIDPVDTTYLNTARLEGKQESPMLIPANKSFQIFIHVEGSVPEKDFLVLQAEVTDDSGYSEQPEIKMLEKSIKLARPNFGTGSNGYNTYNYETYFDFNTTGLIPGKLYRIILRFNDGVFPTTLIYPPESGLSYTVGSHLTNFYVE